MALTATFDPVLSRVRLAATVLDDGVTALFERSPNTHQWTTVRGGGEVTVTGADTAAVDDYEFAPGVVNYYRVTCGSDTFTASVTPDQTGVWFKSLTRPFLNREVAVVSHSDIVRPARNGIFPVIGRSYPVAITDVRLAGSWDMTIKAETPGDADVLDLVFASGDPLFVQVPATGVLSTVPGGYVVVGDVVRRRYGTVSQRRWFDLPLTLVAAPGPGVYGVPATWETIVAEFGTWTAVLAEVGTWADLADYISSPSVVVVP